VVTSARAGSSQRRVRRLASVTYRHYQQQRGGMAYVPSPRCFLRRQLQHKRGIAALFIAGSNIACFVSPLPASSRGLLCLAAVVRRAAVTRQHRFYRQHELAWLLQRNALRWQRFGIADAQRAPLALFGAPTTLAAPL